MCIILFSLYLRHERRILLVPFDEKTDIFNYICSEEAINADAFGVSSVNSVDVIFQNKIFLPCLKTYL